MGEARRRHINEAANPPTHATPIGRYLDKAALAEAGFIELPFSNIIMTDISISELWDREKANLRRFRGRQADLSPYLDLAQCEAQARRWATRMQKAARAEKQRANAKKYAETYAPRRVERTRPAAPKSTRRGVNAHRAAASTIA
jgi:hypothetical protein